MKIIALLIFSLFAGLAVAAEEIPAPRLKVGDACTYEIRDLLKPEKKIGGRRVLKKIVEIQGDTIVVSRGNREGAQMGLEKITGMLNVVEDASGVFSPYFPSFDFPIWVGKTWQAKSEHVSSSGVKTRYETTGKVVSLEKVEVPAGVFQAFRILLDTDYAAQAPDGRTGQGKLKEIRWYSPTARGCFIRSEFETTDWYGGPGVRRRTVLFSYD